MVDLESWVAPMTSGSRMILAGILYFIHLLYQVISSSQACLKHLVQ